ncbi:MAG: DUF350 domain-containing protein [Candidatus Dadabacteria bacterium]|nr:DUF350 domain-containing protein [Candidatus Dadabacteria bacterium]NIQ16576.1 DUF350 domain-containing protein [Candidatus Dadabacteria bacterium]
MQFNIILLNFIYAVIGGVVTILFMFLGFYFLDKLTHFNTSEELAKGNRAVGSVVAGIFIGIGIAVGLVIGMGLN